MHTMSFTAASAVYFPFASAAEAERIQKEDAVSQFGFYTSVDLSGQSPTKNATVRISARHVYRLYINGKIVMHGPARTAHGYARVDEIDVANRLTDGENHIAVEVMTYGSVYNGYSNDMSIEDGPGFLIAELALDGEVLTATGRDPWGVCPIGARRTRTARISHCREASEIYDLDDAYSRWRLGRADFVPAIPAEAPVFLKREALLPTLEVHEFRHLVGFGSCSPDENRVLPRLFYEANSDYYDSLTEYPLEDCRRTVETLFGRVTVTRDGDGLTMTGADDTFVMLDGGENYVGFPSIACFCEKDGIIDIVHTELLNLEGSVSYDHNIVTRLHVKAGYTTFTAMEPGIGRWLKIYFRGTGKVTLSSAAMVDFTYPDEHRASFLCSDDDVNRLYSAAKRTLLFNTLDVFMDCPDRERGGWLCDSLWTSRAAALMLSDTRVEKEFLENFLLTPADGMFHGFFPEAYPGNKPSYKDMTGITTWSFWLLCEVSEYVERTGDTAFRDRFADRVAAFVKGSQDFIGRSGLLENLPWLFIDWSMSNYEEYQQPISTPANALYAYMLIGLGKTFGHPEWITEGERIRGILRAAIAGEHEEKLMTITTFPDSFTYGDDGKLHGRGRISETGMATALWAELFAPGEVPALDRYLRDCMGPAPRYAADPGIGKSQLFIGLCIRLDVLARRGHFSKLWEDMHAIYMPQLREGPGTLWETTDITASSRCHGFNSHAGVHLIRDVLGLDIPDGMSKTIRLAPHLMGLRWARGTFEVPEGLILVSWQYDGDRFTMDVSLPAGYSYTLILPREVRALDEENVSVTIRTRD